MQYVCACYGCNPSVSVVSAMTCRVYVCQTPLLAAYRPRYHGRALGYVRYAARVSWLVDCASHRRIGTNVAITESVLLRSVHSDSSRRQPLGAHDEERDIAELVRQELLNV